MRPDPTLLNVSLIGNKHVNRGTPCEDASFSLSANGVHVVVVADGAGGSKYTHARFGARCAVECVAELMTKHFDAFYFENRESVSRSLLVTAIHSKMADLLVEHELDGLERLSCTLLFVAVKGDMVLAGHIGDGMICRVSSHGLSPLTLPANGENASSTYFITFPNAQEYLRFIRTTTDDTHAFVLMTDGVEEMVYDSSTQLVRPVVARLAELAAQGKEKGEETLKSTIQEFVVDAGQQTDDASVGVLYLCGTNAPDFSALNDSKSKIERDFTDTIKSVQMEWVPQVKHAQEILSKINCQNTVKSDTLEVSKKEENAEDSEDVKANISSSEEPKQEEKVEKGVPDSPEVTSSSPKMVPLWAFLVMTGLFISSLVALALLLL